WLKRTEFHNLQSVLYMDRRGRNTGSPSSSSPVLSRWNTNDFDDRRVCFKPNTRGVALYVAGALFGIGWWEFIDALIYTAINKDAIFSDISFEDYICGILSTIGMF
ncbi:2912_t:CDS:2, partial [Scutellospora calospora]